MEPSIVQQGIELMLFGMGTVFVFLALLVVATICMSAVVERLPEAEPPQVSKETAASPSAMSDQTLVAVITASIHKYRSRNK